MARSSILTILAWLVDDASRQQGRMQMLKAKKKSSPKSPEPKDIEIGRLIRAQRLLRGFSQTELADAIGVTFQQVQKYEKGMNRIGSGRLYRIADKLKVPVTFFFDGATGPKKVADNINEGLEFVRTAETLRLLRAFEKMDRRAQHHFLALIEIMTSGRKASRLPSIH
jgi:transcriptional regulator with XRE-family HTH domain